MRQLYLDALAIIRDIGGPDLFITFTANPEWKEVKEQLRPGEKVVDRPDLLNNVFKAKLDELLHVLYKKQLFGKVAGYIYVIEFQKRGKPHAHILLSMAPEDKFRTKERVDKFFCAELPDPIKNPILFDKVTKMMVHGPCSDTLCKENGVCSKGFPKPCVEDTYFDSNHNCHLRRRGGLGKEVSTKGNKRRVSNADVVAYSPILLLMFDAHINCEVVSSSQRAVKYIFKYIFKGYDVANLKVMKDDVLHYDEVANFINSRYIAANEAHWRIVQYVLYGRSHTVIREALHLPNTELKEVVFEDGYDVVPEQEDDYMVSMLTAFFKLCKGPAGIDDMSNQSDEMVKARQLVAIARKCRYVDIPKHFIYDAPKRQWVERKANQDNVVSRMRDVSPYNQETFALRMLLLHVVGPTGFRDVRTWGGITYDTFVQCAQARNIIADDDCYYRAFDDYIALRTPHRLRDLFASMLLTGTIFNGQTWWAKYRDDLGADFKLKNPIPTADQVYEQVLQHLERIFLERSKRCANFGLPAPKLKLDRYISAIDKANNKPMDPKDFKLNSQQKVWKKYRQKLLHIYIFIFFAVFR